MEILLNWLILISIFSLALASPGPDFVVAVKNSILHSKLIGILTALGFAAGVLIHVSFAIFGIAAIISQSTFLFSVIKYAGAAYLLYIGIQSLRSSGFNKKINLEASKKELKNLQALWQGFLTNLLNPKATIFFLSVFSQFITTDTAWGTKIFYASTCVIMTFLWFSFVALVLSNPKIKEKFIKFTKWIDRVCGGLLIALAIKLALTKV